MSADMPQISLSPISNLKWFLLGRGSKKRNKRMLLHLAEYNHQGQAPRSIRRNLQLSAQDIEFLLSLSSHKDTYLKVCFSGGAYDGIERLSRLGLVLAKSMPARLRLADAGRFALVLLLTPGLEGPAYDYKPALTNK